MVLFPLTVITQYTAYKSLIINIVDRFPKQKYNFTGSENKKVNENLLS